MHIPIHYRPRVSILAYALLISGLIHAVAIFSIRPAMQSGSSDTTRGQALHVRIGAAPSMEHAWHPEAAKETPAPAPATPITTSSPSPGSSKGLVLPNKYFEVQELDTLPEPHEEIVPEYPLTALSNSITGTVHLEIFIDENGLVESVRAIDSVPPGIFEQSAKDAFMHQKFQPGLKNGIPVKAHLKVVVHFDDSTEHPR